MKISIEFDGIQEDKQYNFSFCLSSDGEVMVKKSSPSKSKKKEGPSLDDFEEKEGPSLDDFKEKPGSKEIKIESSFDGKIDPT